MAHITCVLIALTCLSIYFGVFNSCETNFILASRAHFPVFTETSYKVTSSVFGEKLSSNFPKCLQDSFVESCDAHFRITVVIGMAQTAVWSTNTATILAYGRQVPMYGAETRGHFAVALPGPTLLGL